MLLEKEELGEKQRAKQHWLQYGDQNKNLFHLHVQIRGERRLLLSVQRMTVAIVIKFRVR